MKHILCAVLLVSILAVTTPLPYNNGANQYLSQKHQSNNRIPFSYIEKNLLTLSHFEFEEPSSSFIITDSTYATHSQRISQSIYVHRKTNLKVTSSGVVNTIPLEPLKTANNVRILTPHVQSHNPTIQILVRSEHSCISVRLLKNHHYTTQQCSVENFCLLNFEIHSEWWPLPSNDPSIVEVEYSTSCEKIHWLPVGRVSLELSSDSKEKAISGGNNVNLPFCIGNYEYERFTLRVSAKEFTDIKVITADHKNWNVTSIAENMFTIQSDRTDAAHSRWGSCNVMVWIKLRAREVSKETSAIVNLELSITNSIREIPIAPSFDFIIHPANKRVVHFVAWPKEQDVINTATLNGKPSSTTFDFIEIMGNAEIKMVQKVNCTFNSSNIQMSNDCRTLTVNQHTSPFGSIGEKIQFIDSGSETEASMNLYVPDDIIIRAQDLILQRIYIGGNQHWMVNNNHECDFKYQDSEYDILTRFYAQSDDDNREYLFDENKYAVVNDLVQISIRNQTVATVDRRLIHGKVPGQTDVQVKSPLSSDILASRLFRVESEAISLKKVVMNMVSSYGIVDKINFTEGIYSLSVRPFSDKSLENNYGTISVTLQFTDMSFTSIDFVPEKEYSIFTESFGPTKLKMENYRFFSIQDQFTKTTQVGLRSKIFVYSSNCELPRSVLSSRKFTTDVSLVSNQQLLQLSRDAVTKEKNILGSISPHDPPDYDTAPPQVTLTIFEMSGYILLGVLCVVCFAFIINCALIPNCRIDKCSDVQSPFCTAKSECLPIAEKPPISPWTYIYATHPPTRTVHYSVCACCFQDSPPEYQPPDYNASNLPVMLLNHKQKRSHSLPDQLQRVCHTILEEDEPDHNVVNSSV
uniref:TMEM132D-like protein n=1 Tax=Hofstenia miamia TaxID=442651 RepID=A0A5P8I4N1_HOFMI|nr:TMEM132D-like protein [Hofstenia miamia]